MNTTAIRNYAQQARRDFRKLVTEKAQSLGIDSSKIEEAVVKGDALIVHGQAFPVSMKKQRDELVSLVKAKGFGAVVDEMAYTLFNRFSALRFMEVHDYLPQRVFSAKDGGDTPDILRNALDVADALFPTPKERDEIREMRMGRARFTVAHEIGHVIMHAPWLRAVLQDGKNVLKLNRSSIPAYLDPECQANAFASALLMPTTLVASVLDRGGNWTDIHDLFHVSPEAARYRVTNLEKFL
jgi:hypothetical protein